jgi:hypothetical protein
MFTFQSLCPEFIIYITPKIQDDIPASRPLPRLSLQLQIPDKLLHDAPRRNVPTLHLPLTYFCSHPDYISLPDHPSVLLLPPQLLPLPDLHKPTSPIPGHHPHPPLTQIPVPDHHRHLLPHELPPLVQQCPHGHVSINGCGVYVVADCAARWCGWRGDQLVCGGVDEWGVYGL